MITKVNRRTALVSGAAAAIAASVPAAKAAKPALNEKGKFVLAKIDELVADAYERGKAAGRQPGPNDRRLQQLAQEWHALERRHNRMGRIAERRYDCDPEDAPFANAYEALLTRQYSIGDELIGTPADTAAGSAAKLSVLDVLESPIDVPCGLTERFRWSALQDVRQFAGRV